jgi:hypothetical protein
MSYADQINALSEGPESAITHDFDLGFRSARAAARCIAAEADARIKCLEALLARREMQAAELQLENAELRKDAERLDWLSQQFVTVRIPLRYGSRECFMGSPDDNDGESVPWDIRARIDAAITGAAK